MSRLAAAGVVALALLATACSTATPVPTATPRPSIDEIIERAIQHNPELSSLSKSKILEVAYAFCSIAASQPGADYFFKLREYEYAADLTSEQGTSINVWVAVDLCPEDVGQAAAAAS